MLFQAMAHPLEQLNPVDKLVLLFAAELNVLNPGSTSLNSGGLPSLNI